jgi:hypothetical protein
MKRSSLLTVFGIITCFATVAPVLAHHSFAAEFDLDKPITLQGIAVKSSR